MRALLILLVAAAPALAEPTGDRAAAERYFRAGARAYASQRFGAAVANFDEAYRTLPLPEIAFSAAQAYRRLYRVEPRPAYVQRAVELYRLYLDKVKTGGRVGDAADSLGEMERELDKLKARGAQTETKVVERTRLGIDVTLGDQAEATALREIGDADRGDPRGEQLTNVAITLDGKPVEPFALIDVVPGEHVVKIAAEGYFPVEKKQRAVKGASAVIEIALVERPAKLQIQTERGARVAIDGRGMPSAAFELAAGKHLLTVTRRGRKPFDRELVLDRGQSLVVAAPLSKTWRARAVPWVLGGAGALGLLASVSLLGVIVEHGKASDLRDALDDGNQLPEIGDAYDAAVHRRNEARVATIVFGTGALVAGTTGLLLHLLDHPQSERLSVAPLVAPGAAGVGARGVF